VFAGGLRKKTCSFVFTGYWGGLEAARAGAKEAEQTVPK
jgi:hypothetical protein